MLQTQGKFSKRDGGLRQYYHCRNFYCSYTALAPRFDAEFLEELVNEEDDNTTGDACEI